jgi:hypothetical protein
MDFTAALTPTTVAALIGALVPILVSLLAKSGAPDGVRVALNLAITALASAALTIVGPGDTFALNAFVGSWLTAFVTSISAYYGAYKPTGVAEAVNTATGSFGFGVKDDSEPLDDVVFAESGEEESYNPDDLIEKAEQPADLTGNGGVA